MNKRPIFQYFAFIPFSNEERKKAANFEVIKYLIEKGAEVDGKNARGKTPLYYAVKNNLDMEIVEYFITKGADSYAKNGQTLVADDFCPLQMAIGKKETQNALKKYVQFVPCNFTNFYQNRFILIKICPRKNFVKLKFFFPL